MFTSRFLRVAVCLLALGVVLRPGLSFPGRPHETNPTAKVPERGDGMGLLPIFRRAADKSVHKELHRELVRHDGSKVPPFSAHWTSLIPADAAIDIVNPGSGPSGYAPVLDTDPLPRSYLRPWFSTKDKHSWYEFADILCEFAPFPWPVSFGVQGNRRGIHYFLGVDPADANAVSNLLKMHLPNAWIEHTDSFSVEADWLAKGGHDLSFGFYDFRPAGSRFGRLRIPPKSSPPPMASIVIALSQLGEKEWGFVEILFQADQVGFTAKLRMVSAIAEHSSGLGIAARYPGPSLAHDMTAMLGAREKLSPSSAVWRK